MKRRSKAVVRIGQLVAVAALLGLFLFAAGPASADGGDPVVVAHSPADEAIRVSVNAAISITWSQAMAPDSDFMVSGPSGFVDGAFDYDPRLFTVTFTPAAYLKPETRYDVLVTGQVDAEGRWQEGMLQWAFTTVTPTSVSLTNFSPGSTGSNWWWTAWPWLMLLISAGSLVGFMRIWKRRPLVIDGPNE